ncbi:MAG: aldehyde dehydrogenase family protein [Paracoccaceae bacterium]
MASSASDQWEVRLTRLLDAQRRAFQAARAPDRAARLVGLGALKTALRAHKAGLIRAAAQDFGRRSAEETVIYDLGQVVQAINHLSRNLRRWMRPERRGLSWPFLPGRARVIYQPKGVVGVMAPWNYPYNLSLVPLATALAAGNRVMLKPSEHAPESARAMARLLEECFDADEVAVVQGDAVCGAAFAALPFDHLVFTGSTAVGAKVMRAAAANLVPVTLELGGKSPVIVMQGADLGRAARDIAWGKIANAGQTCIAPDYALVHEEDAGRLVSLLADEMARLVPDGARDPKMTTIISQHHADRLRGLLDDARAKGAAVTEIGAGAAARAVAPAILAKAGPEMDVMREEIFGPLLPVLTYASADEAISFVIARPRPLALYVYGPAGAARDAVLARTISGNVTVNGVMTHFGIESLPFGGIGASGIGAYHGREGFLAMSHAKGVYYQPKFSMIPLGRVPGGRFARLYAWFTMR